LLALFPNLAIKKVTQLEPRTPHQPEKLKKRSKNEYGFTDFAGFGQSKIIARNYLCFQSSAARPQPYDRFWCSPASHSLSEPAPDTHFAAFARTRNRRNAPSFLCFTIVNIPPMPRPMMNLARQLKNERDGFGIESARPGYGFRGAGLRGSYARSNFHGCPALVAAQAKKIETTLQLISSLSSSSLFLLSSPPVSSKDWVSAALPFSTLVIT
jgi:hypothetical protein